MGTESYGSVGEDWIVTKPDHWIYKDTCLAQNDRIQGIIGWEYHGTSAPIPGLAAAELYPRNRASKPKQHHAAFVFSCGKGNWVFNA